MGLYAKALGFGEQEPERLNLLISAVALDPESIPYRYGLARAYYYKEDYENTVAQCAEVIKRDPGHTRALTVMGSAYFFSGDFHKAIAAQEAALKVDPGNFYAQFNLACACGQVDKERARIEWQKYIRMADDEPSQERYVEWAERYLKQLSAKAAERRQP